MEKIGARNYYSQNSTWADEITVRGDKEAMGRIKAQATNEVLGYAMPTIPRITRVWWGPTGAYRIVKWGQETTEVEYYLGEFDEKKAIELLTLPIV